VSITLQLNAAYAILAAIVAVTFVVCCFRFLMRREENRRLKLLQPEPVIWPQRMDQDTNIYRESAGVLRVRPHEEETNKLPDAS